MAVSGVGRNILAIVLGAADFSAARLGNDAAFEISASSFREYLCSPDGLALPDANVLWLFQNRDSADSVDKEIGKFLANQKERFLAAGETVSDVLVYYTGHGILPDNEFTLAFHTTEANRLRASSYRIVDLATTLKEHARYTRRLLILDCCFAAAAYAAFQAPATDVVAVQTREAFADRGTSLLCAAAPSRPAKIRTESGPTATGMTLFSECLLEVLRNGESRVQRDRLSLVEVGKAVEELLRIRFDNSPRPMVKSPDERDGDVARVPIFPNLAWVAARDASSLAELQAVPIISTIQAKFALERVGVPQTSSLTLSPTPFPQSGPTDVRPTTTFAAALTPDEHPQKASRSDVEMRSTAQSGHPSINNGFPLPGRVPRTNTGGAEIDGFDLRAPAPEEQASDPALAGSESNGTKTNLPSPPLGEGLEIGPKPPPAIPFRKVVLGGALLAVMVGVAFAAMTLSPEFIELGSVLRAPRGFPTSPSKTNKATTPTATSSSEPAPAPTLSASTAVATPTILRSKTFNNSERVEAEVIVLARNTTLRVRGGSTLEIVAAELRIEGPVLIDGTGIKGKQGAHGSGSPPMFETDSYGDWERSCASEVDRGGDGAGGEAGGPGATVVIRYRVLHGDASKLRVLVAGGSGGEGGPGAGGRLCRGPDRTAHQKYGPTGRTGPRGAAGHSGTFSMLQDNDDDGQSR